MSTKILDTAQNLVQQRGFNAFSYRDLSNIIGIKTSSIHYYFPTKDDLAENLVARYRKWTKEAFDQIEHKAADERECLSHYFKLFEEAGAEQNAMCLCGMLASDYVTLSEKTQQEVRLFFNENEAWLARILETGRQQKKFKFVGAAQETARLIFASVEGAMLAARMFNNETRLQRLSEHWLKILN